MNAGGFDQRVTIQSKTATRAANGEEVLTWTTFATVWAKVEQLSGREFFAGAQMQDWVNARVTIRYKAGVVHDMRVTWRGDPLEVVSVVEKGRKEYVELMCRRVA